MKLHKNNTLFENAYLAALEQGRGSRLDYIRELYGKKIAPEGLVELLQIAMVDEWLAEYNYFASANLAMTQNRSDYLPEFQQHEDEERDHRKEIVKRLRQLGATAPAVPIREFETVNSAGQDWKQELERNSDQLLVNRYREELAAVEFYDFVLRYAKQLGDSTTERMIKEIKGDEEEHAQDLKDQLLEHNVKF